MRFMSLAYLVSVMPVLACSASGGTSPNQQQGGAGGQGGVGVDASPTYDAPTAFDVFVPPDVIPGVIRDGDTCQGITRAAEPFPLDMYVMMDQSGSMKGPIDINPFGPTQWDAVKSAFVGFLNGTSPEGMSMGIQYFPLALKPWSTLPQCSNGSCGSGASCLSTETGNYCLSTCGSDANCDPKSDCMSFENNAGDTLKVCSNDSCDPGAYAKPEVPIGAIPGVNQQLLASLDKHGPTSMTPSAPALEGAIRYAREWANDHPDHTTVVVFATDGQPTVCNKALIATEDVKAIAREGLSGSPSVRTFVLGVIPMGMGMISGSLNEVAFAGGTGQAHLVTVGPNMAEDFKNKLEAIRGASMDCEFKLPNGGTGLDYNQVNVLYVAHDKQKYDLYYVGSPNACDPNIGGWYYDVDPKGGTPTKIVLCPQNCGFIQGYGGSVEIKIGCETITPPK